MRKEYNAVLKSGMFWEFFPELSGDYEKDKTAFKSIYRNIMKMRKGITGS